ncbi:hypothetical protein NDU88_006614 [Pleurodeles waltl]|uniref:Uncharacterized protein n=1 Tax=Pleurodeles waltl TaxID=8319 RepID=A0AAV7MDC7_PLEWA|nr:hypothetical protein NDU88_006614 [Pleurodeles waltl]
MLRPSHFRLCFCFFLAVLFIKGLAEKEKAAGLKGLARVPALPLIQVLLEQLPPKPRVLWKRQVSSQHLNYMLNLYRKSADRDGRPKVNRSVDSNMVRLVKPFDTADLYVQVVLILALAGDEGLADNSASVGGEPFVDLLEHLELTQTENIVQCFPSYYATVYVDGGWSDETAVQEFVRDLPVAPLQREHTMGLEKDIALEEVA